MDDTVVRFPVVQQKTDFLRRVVETVEILICWNSYVQNTAEVNIADHATAGLETSVTHDFFFFSKFCVWAACVPILTGKSLIFEPGNHDRCLPIWSQQSWLVIWCTTGAVPRIRMCDWRQKSGSIAFLVHHHVRWSFYLGGMVAAKMVS